MLRNGWPPSFGISGRNQRNTHAFTNLIDNAEPLRIRVKSREKLTRESDLLIDQIRAIDNRRITSGPIANLESELMKRVYQAVLEVIGINLFAA